MSKVIAVLNGGKWVFYDMNGKKTELDGIERYSVYVLLPDEYFFFFQTDVVSKRRARESVEAYAKSNFPVSNGYVGYVKGSEPLVGYVYFYRGLGIEIDSVLQSAEAITTPFRLRMFLEDGGSFVYSGDSVVAVCSHGKIERYLRGPSEGVIPQDSEYKEIRQGDCAENVRLFSEVIREGKAKHVHLPVVDKGRKEKWSAVALVSIGVAVIMFVVGGIFRYEGYVGELKIVETKLSSLYDKALSGKHYRDPFGVLLYKAHVGSSDTDKFDPMRLLYALSKAKKSSGVKIDYVSYDENGGLRIKGSVSSYAELVGYVNRVNKLLSKGLVIQSTSSVKGNLRFALGYRGGG